MNKEKIQITPDEYPPKYIGTKGNGDIKMVYRIDGEMGLVFHMINHKESEYRWEHFDLIQKSK
jgi:hypothetical protein